MNSPPIYSSLTRISPLPQQEDLRVEALSKEQWATGDYVVCTVRPSTGAHRHIELVTGRMREGMPGDRLVGALGRRFATLEATGTWEEAEAGAPMHLLTGAGLVGKCTSRSPFIKPLMELEYVGHVLLERGEKATMQGFLGPGTERRFETPVLLIVGTSMSAGKTSAARVLIQQLKRAGLRVLGAKLAGAGRFRDILSMSDAGAEWIFDFVDAGLPSTVLPEADYRLALRGLLSRMAGPEADVAVVEIGASPLEPYNGAAAIAAIQENIWGTVLCASDPYAAAGVMQAFDVRPSFISGIATNTLAGLSLIEELCDVPAFNLLDPASLPEVRRVLERDLPAHLPVAAFEDERGEHAG